MQKSGLSGTALGTAFSMGCSFRKIRPKDGRWCSNRSFLDARSHKAAPRSGRAPPDRASPACPQCQPDAGSLRSFAAHPAGGSDASVQPLRNTFVIFRSANGDWAKPRLSSRMSLRACARNSGLQARSRPAHYLRTPNNDRQAAGSTCNQRAITALPPLARLSDRLLDQAGLDQVGAGHATVRVDGGVTPHCVSDGFARGGTSKLPGLGDPQVVLCTGG